MPKCKNDSSRYFKGTEPSPKGLGWCAHGINNNSVKRGKDGKQWIVRTIRNGSKRWSRLHRKTTPVRKVKNSTIRDLTSNEMKRKLKSIGVHMLVCKHKKINGFWIQNVPWNYAEKRFGTDYLDRTFVIVVLKMEDSKTVHLGDGGIYLQHNNITYKKKKDLKQVMKDAFGRKFSWNGKQSDALFVKL